MIIRYLLLSITQRIVEVPCLMLALLRSVRLEDRLIQTTDFLLF